MQEPFPPKVRKVLETYPRGKDGYILKLFRVFANSVRFLDKKGVLNLLDDDSPLLLREREIVILRVTAISGCEYEWGVHAAFFSKAAGLTDTQIGATCSDQPGEDCWTDAELVLIKCVDELHSQQKIQDDTYEKFQAIWTLEQQLEILALCGNYHTVCMVANTARIDPEPFGLRFSSANRSSSSS